MSLVKDAVSAMKEVLVLNEKINQVGKTMGQVSIELREHDKRLVRLETYIEIAQKHLSGK